MVDSNRSESESGNENKHISTIMRQISEYGSYIEITLKTGEKRDFRYMGGCFNNFLSEDTSINTERKVVLRLLGKDNKGYDIDVMDVERVSLGEAF